MIEAHSIFVLDGEAVQSDESTGNKSSSYIDSESDSNSDSDSDSVDELIKIVVPNCLMVDIPVTMDVPIPTRKVQLSDLGQSHCNQSYVKRLRAEAKKIKRYLLVHLTS